MDWVVLAALAGTWGVLAGGVGAEPELPAYLYLDWAGVALAVIDLHHHRLPDLLVLPSYPIAVVLRRVTPARAVRNFSSALYESSSRVSGPTATDVGKR